ncbi:MAG: DNA endonuclease SmrA [Pseudomonadota bacterium]|nr:DNA endonuclease SmrA [Pseudomonadota bacterium]
MSKNDDNSDEALFKSYYEHVKPLQTKKRHITESKPTTADTEQHSIRRQLASEHQYVDQNPLSHEVHRYVGPHDIIGFKQPGVQDGVYRKLRLGKYGYSAKLDLHKKQVEQARHQVYQFIKQSHNLGRRTVLITHGKGDPSGEGKSIVKSHCIEWLKQLPEVLAFHSCQPPDGGAGSVYVMIKKNKVLDR